MEIFSTDGMHYVFRITGEKRMYLSKDATHKSIFYVSRKL